jgi:hypothetical protein
MSEFDPAAFTSEIEGAGVKLTAIPLADGKYRVSRWFMGNADRNRIEKLWAGQIGDNQRHLDQLAWHLARRPPAPRALVGPLLRSLTDKPPAEGKR